MRTGSENPLNYRHPISFRNRESLSIGRASPQSSGDASSTTHHNLHPYRDITRGATRSHSEAKTKEPVQALFSLALRASFFRRSARSVPNGGLPAVKKRENGAPPLSPGTARPKTRRLATPVLLRPPAQTACHLQRTNAGPPCQTRKMGPNHIQHNLLRRGEHLVGPAASTCRIVG